MRALVLIGAFIGALCLLGSFFLNSAPQQAAMAATACAFAIIPYVAFRVSQLEDAALQRKVFFEHVRKRLEELLDAKQ
jgi:hypothetical protein